MPAGRKPVVRCTRSEWCAIKNRIHACCPPPEGYSWSLIRSDGVPSDRRGDCERHESRRPGHRGKIVVRVATGMSESETVDVALHEVAHAYDAWCHHGWQDDHGDTFWIWLGRVYRRYWS